MSSAFILGLSVVYMWLASSPNITSISMAMASMVWFGLLIPCEWCMTALTLVGVPFFLEVGQRRWGHRYIWGNILFF